MATKAKLLDVVENNSRNYGKYVVEQRAIPDFRDGLKPVQRRILWAMFNLKMWNNGPNKKSARITGETMGKYHPHGNQAIYDSLVNMVNLPAPLVQGQGNWGSAFGANAAAERYTEAKLSEYAEKILLNQDYMTVIQTVPNYDGSEKEPVILPALLPNILFNGSEGIAYAVRTGIPSFKRKGVYKLIKLLLEGKTIDHKDCADNLHFNFMYGGGEVLSSKAELRSFFKDGSGTITFRCERKISSEKKQYVIISQTPHFNYDRVHAKISELPAVASVDKAADLEVPFKVIIRLKKKTSPQDMKDTWSKIDSILTERLQFSINITVRKVDDVAFKETSIPDLLTRWVKYRVALEVKMLEYKRDRLKEDIAYHDLLLLAIANLEQLVKIIKTKGQTLDQIESKIEKLLKVSREDARTVLGLTLRRLSNLSEGEVTAKRKQLSDELKGILIDIKKPEARILRWMETL
jgi:DNA gyrase/topoisomerase IV subunit A